jgi:hypothetical protein
VGIFASWISIGGIAEAEVLSRLQVVETGETRDENRWLRSDEVGLASLPGGRVLLLSWKNWEIDAEIARTLSVGCEAVVGHFGDNTMHSAAYGFRNGRKRWSVVYDPDRDVYGVTAKGQVPAELTDWLEETHRNERIVRNGGDYFDLPVRLAGQIGRYRPDQDIDGWQPEFRLVDNPNMMEDGPDRLPPLWFMLLHNGLPKIEK